MSRRKIPITNPITGCKCSLFTNLGGGHLRLAWLPKDRRRYYDRKRARKGPEEVIGFFPHWNWSPHKGSKKSRRGPHTPPPTRSCERSRGLGETSVAPGQAYTTIAGLPPAASGRVGAKQHVRPCRFRINWPPGFHRCTTRDFLTLTTTTVHRHNTVTQRGRIE